MGPKLTFPAKVHPITGKLLGPEAERMVESLLHHYPGEFVLITVEGMNSRDVNPRGYYFKIIVPAVLNALKDTGHNLDPDSKSDRDNVHELLKEYFIAGEKKTTKNFSRGHWSKFNKSIEDWLLEHFHYSLKERKQ